MFNRPTTFNTSALACAALVTLAMLGFVDGLAKHEGEAAQMAAKAHGPVATASSAPRG